MNKSVIAPINKELDFDNLAKHNNNFANLADKDLEIFNQLSGNLATLSSDLTNLSNSVTQKEEALKITDSGLNSKIVSNVIELDKKIVRTNDQISLNYANQQAENKEIYRNVYGKSPTNHGHTARTMMDRLLPREELTNVKFNTTTNEYDFITKPQACSMYVPEGNLCLHLAPEYLHHQMGICSVILMPDKNVNIRYSMGALEWWVKPFPSTLVANKMYFYFFMSTMELRGWLGNCTEYEKTGIF